MELTERIKEGGGEIWKTWQGERRYFLKTLYTAPDQAGYTWAGSLSTDLDFLVILKRTKKMFPLYYMHSDVLSRFKSLNAP